MEHHEHTHTHEHTHCHSHEHDHAHSHDHDHSHHHSHEHLHAENGVAAAETVALLKYMLDHNIHHAKELSDLASRLTGEARHQLLHAVEAFDQGNGYLSAALEHME